MKYLYIISIFIILFSTQSYAEEQSIAQLIKEVKEAKNDARRQAMNRLKLKLRSVNEETRQQVMMQLRQSFASGQQMHFPAPTLSQQKNPKINIQQGQIPQQSIPKQNIPQQTPQQTNPKHTPYFTPQNSHGGHP